MIPIVGAPHRGQKCGILGQKSLPAWRPLRWPRGAGCTGAMRARQAAGSAGKIPRARATSFCRAPAATWRTHAALKASVHFFRVAGKPPAFSFSVMGSEREDCSLSVLLRPPQVESRWSCLKTVARELREYPIYTDLAKALASAADNFDCCNHEQLHSSIGYYTPYSTHQQPLEDTPLNCPAWLNHLKACVAGTNRRITLV